MNKAELIILNLLSPKKIKDTSMLVDFTDDL